MPGTAAQRNLLDPFDPVQALPKSAEFLHDLRAHFGNLGLAAAAYNAGPWRVQEWINGIASLPRETRAYVQAITGAAVEQWASGQANDDLKLKPSSSCGELMALARNSPHPFIEALEQRILTGSKQPWSVIMAAGFSGNGLSEGTPASNDRMPLHLPGMTRTLRNCVSTAGAIRLSIKSKSVSPIAGKPPRFAIALSTNTGPAWSCAIPIREAGARHRAPLHDS